MIEDKKIQAIIVEDQAEARDFLEQLLRSNFEAIEITGLAPSVTEAVNLIKTNKPDLLFLDIELEDGLSFEILDQVSIPDTEVIFVTAFNQFYQRAMEHFAFSYLLKPVDENLVVQVIERYLKLKKPQFDLERYRNLVQFLDTANSRILIQIGHEHRSVAVAEILKLEADGNYAWIHLQDGEKHMASKSLKHYEDLLVPKGFFKANRTTLVNTDHIRSIYKKESIILSNKDHVPVSVRNKGKLTELINRLS